jgi:hypothetical protein
MSRIREIIKNSIVKDNEGENRYLIKDFPNLPSTDKNLDYLFILMSLQSMILNDEKIFFPTKFDIWFLDIIPNKKNLSEHNFSIDGIKKIIEENKTKLLEKKFFIKFQILFNNSNSLPTIRIHFYNFSDRGVNEISNESFLYPFIFFIYEEKIFNKRRIDKMKKVGINPNFIQILPMVNLCPVKFEENGEIISIIELERYLNRWNNEP